MEHARALYGELPAPQGVVHVVSAARGEDGRFHVINIGPRAPKSETDFFVLQLSRARADAVLSSAQILRAEPELRLAFTGELRESFDELRWRALGKNALVCAVLTRTGDLPRAHPWFSEPLERLVFTGEERAKALQEELGTRAEVVGLQEPSARTAIAALRARGLSAISVEAGPTAVAALYRDEPSVDELWLSRVEVPDLPSDVLGGALPPDAQLFAGLTCASSVLRDELSGPWRFERWVRPPQAATSG